MAVILEPVLLRSRRTAIHGATILLVQTLMAALLALPMFAQVKPTDEKVPCRNSKDVFALFDRLGYTPKAWQAGHPRDPACLPRGYPRYTARSE